MPWLGEDCPLSNNENLNQAIITILLTVIPRHIYNELVIIRSNKLRLEFERRLVMMTDTSSGMKIR
jgi:hypothetical protein